MKVACATIGMFLCAGTLVGDEYDGYRLKVVEESKDVDAFENGSFEAGAKRGPVGKFAEIGSFGVNGGGGLRIRPNNGTVYYGLKLNENRLIKGNRYVFSADVKTVGNVGGLGRKHEATFTLPVGCGKLKSRLGHVTEQNGTYTFTGGPFSCDILEEN